MRSLGTGYWTPMVVTQWAGRMTLSEEPLGALVLEAMVGCEATCLASRSGCFYKFFTELLTFRRQR